MFFFFNFHYLFNLSLDMNSCFPSSIFITFFIKCFNLHGSSRYHLTLYFLFFAENLVICFRFIQVLYVTFFLVMDDWIFCRPLRSCWRGSCGCVHYKKVNDTVLMDITSTLEDLLDGVSYENEQHEHGSYFSWSIYLNKENKNKTNIT